MDELENLLTDQKTQLALSSNRLTSSKFHELVAIIQEFGAKLKEEDLTDNSLKVLTLKKNPGEKGGPNIQINYLGPIFKTIENQNKEEVAEAQKYQIPLLNQSSFSNVQSLMTQNLYPNNQNQPCSTQKSSPIAQNQPVNIPIQSSNDPNNTKIDQVKFHEFQNRFPFPVSNTRPESLSNHLFNNANIPQAKPFYFDFQNVMLNNHNIHMNPLSNPPQQIPQNSLKTNHEKFNQQLEHVQRSNSPNYDDEKYRDRSYVQKKSHQSLNDFNKSNESKSYYKKLAEKDTNRDSQKFPKFESDFKPLDMPNFDINAIKPGVLSDKLCEALKMKSKKEAPPYLANLIKVGLPNYYSKETFYGINTKVPQDFDVKSFMDAGVDPSKIEGYRREVNVICEQNDSLNKSNAPKPASDQDYLNRVLRKPQMYELPTKGLNQTLEPNTIEIE